MRFSPGRGFQKLDVIMQFHRKMVLLCVRVRVCVVGEKITEKYWYELRVCLHRSHSAEGGRDAFGNLLFGIFHPGGNLVYLVKFFFFKI